MATPMAGPVLRRNDSRSHGRRWFFLSVLGALAVAWTSNDGSVPFASGLDTPPRREASGDDGPGTMSAAGSLPTAMSFDGRLQSSPVPYGSNAATVTASHVALKPVANSRSTVMDETPIERALRAIDRCQERYEAVQDYVCTFSKRERIDGRLTPLHVMEMKVRTQPQSIYLKFQQPSPGREAIFIAGRNDGKVLAHDVGIKRLLAGTLSLEPTGGMAMEDCRHPITQAGIGPLLATIEARWMAELSVGESVVAFHEDQTAASRPCTVIETTHPHRQPDFLFFQVRVFVDRELGLPIRFEAYDWPKGSGQAPELVEEYCYSNLKLNVGLRDLDFDITNAEYAFGRF